MALGAYKNLEMHQVDMIIVYPYSKLYTKVYIKALEVLNASKEKVLLIQQSLYSLKQSDRE